jgi:hypothetical protein
MNKLNKERAIDRIIKTKGKCEKEGWAIYCNTCPYRLTSMETNYCSLEGDMDLYTDRIEHRYKKALQIKSHIFARVLS